MRDLFPGYYRPTEEEFEHLWTEGVFAFDASVLLNLYRYTESTTEEFFDLLAALDGRIWLPHQAALEYHRNRPAVILNLEDTYDSVRSRIEEVAQKIRKELKGVLQEGRHPRLHRDEIQESLNQALEEVTEQIEEREEAHPDLLRDDPVRDQIEELFRGKVGDSFDEERLDEIHKDGKKRYKDETPPGYKDQHKAGVSKYGDLVIWKQILSYAAEEGEPIVLVTDDQKEDWWRIVGDETIGPRPELTEEIREETGVLFYQYTPDSFLTNARERLTEDVEQEAIDEVRETRKEDRTKSREARASHRFDLPSTIEVSGLQEAARAVSGIQELAEVFARQKRSHEQLFSSESGLPDLYEAFDVSAMKGIQEALKAEAERIERLRSIALSLGQLSQRESEEGRQVPDNEED